MIGFVPVTSQPIPAIDLFAGPGGLSEGFARVKNDQHRSVFDIRLSIEMDRNARKTLFLRSFRRASGEESAASYDAYLRGDINLRALLSSNRNAARKAFKETWRAELGGVSRTRVRNKIDEALGQESRWILLGGPPCQAYSLVGRSRMLPVQGEKKFYSDPRHQLYKEYLRILADHEPAIFIFENVKGMLSSKLDGAPVFDQIYKDLQNPSAAFRNPDELRHNPQYELFSLTEPEAGSSHELRGNDFVIRSEHYGIPQRRHRVIILGINKRFLTTGKATNPDSLTKYEENDETLINIDQVISDLPKIRSAPSRPSGSFDDWCTALNELIATLVPHSQISMFDDADTQKGILETIHRAIVEASANDRKTGAQFLSHSGEPQYNPGGWYTDGSSGGITNHESRSHMRSDLQRYLYASSFAASSLERRAPTLKDFPESLLPEHKNAATSAKSGHFADRFRVQVKHKPATTITSHISKDGHYYIHYDPSQCRSLTVREAARIQTFSDDYHFEGPRTEQFKQVGNAVPPYLAFQIANIVKNVLRA